MGIKNSGKFGGEQFAGVTVFQGDFVTVPTLATVPTPELEIEGLAWATYWLMLASGPPVVAERQFSLLQVFPTNATLWQPVSGVVLAVGVPAIVSVRLPARAIRFNFTNTGSGGAVVRWFLAGSS